MHPELVLTMAHARQRNLRRSSRSRVITEGRALPVKRPSWRLTLGSAGAGLVHRVRVGH